MRLSSKKLIKSNCISMHPNLFTAPLQIQFFFTSTNRPRCPADTRKAVGLTRALKSLASKYRDVKCAYLFCSVSLEFPCALLAPAFTISRSSVGPDVGNSVLSSVIRSRVRCSRNDGIRDDRRYGSALDTVATTNTDTALGTRTLRTRRALGALSGM